MTEDSEQQGAAPVEDTAVAKPPSVDELATQHDETLTERTRMALRRHPPTAEELAAIEAGGEPVDDADDLLIEGPNSA